MTPLGFCPHCGNESRQKPVHEHRYVVEEDVGEGNVVGFDHSLVFRMCLTCDGPLVYHESETSPAPRLVWPTHGRLDPAVPGPVRAAYQEALRVRRQSPNAFAGLVRKALERACEDKGAEGRSLHPMVEALARRGDLPPSVLRATHLIRLVANRGLHRDEDVSPEEAAALDDFFRMAMDYLYVLPARLARFERDLAEADSRG